MLKKAIPVLIYDFLDFAIITGLLQVAEKHHFINRFF